MGLAFFVSRASGGEGGVISVTSTLYSYKLSRREWKRRWNDRREGGGGIGGRRKAAPRQRPRLPGRGEEGTKKGGEKDFFG